MTNCERCEQPASRFTHEWFQFPGDPRRYQALCDVHWDKLLAQMERRLGKKGRCARCYAEIGEDAKQCRYCGFTYKETDSLKRAA